MNSRTFQRARRLGVLPVFLYALAAAAPVEVSHPVADFLRRMEEKGLAAPGFYGTLPRDETEIAGALAGVAQNESRLRPWDKLRLHRFLAEFDPALRWQGTRLRYGDSQFNLIGGVEYFTAGSVRDSFPKTEAYAFGSLNPAVTATYREKLYLVSTASVGSERSHVHRFAENFDPQRGLPYNTNRQGKAGWPQTVSTFDGYRTVAGYGNGVLRFEAGQDWNQWGPGHWQHATLGARPFFWVADSLGPRDTTGFRGSDSLFPGGYRRGYRYPGEGPPLPQLRLRVGFGRWEYVKVIAQRRGLWSDSSASLVAHRLQVRLGGFTVGLSEMMAVGNHSPDWAAYLPAVPLKFAEHSGGDRDNIALSADVEWVWTGHGRVYGEFYADDFSGPPLEYWGNKFAYSVGISWQDPFDFPAEAHVEFAQADPWVYQHNRRNTQMQSQGALLGSALPPNARALFSSLAFPLPWGAQAEVEWQWGQRDMGSPGSSIFDVHDPNGNPNKEFLARRVETRNQGALSATWQWKRYVLLKAGAGNLWVDGWKGDAARSLTTPLVFGEARIRY